MARRIERVVGAVCIRWINRIGSIAVCRVEGIVWCICLCGVQVVIRSIFVCRVEDVVIALVLRIEPLFGNRGCDGKEQRQEKEDFLL